MSIRMEFEKREEGFMAPYGCLSANSRGRKRAEEESTMRTSFQRDRDRIIYSNAFRRMKYKTQVFLAPLGDQYRTRLTHTLEVAQIARTIARAMRLNEDLAEAIALGHDLGHTPFGHSGEAALKEIFSPGFSHNAQSLRIVDLLEKKGKGLNLTYEVRDGILKHSKGFGQIIADDPNEMASTIEGNIVRAADIMAYLNHDLDDAIRSGVITHRQIPGFCTKVLGNSHSERAATMVRDLVYSSRIQGDQISLCISDQINDAMLSLREFLYENVYRATRVHKEFVKAKKILSELYTFFLENEDLLASELTAMDLPVVNHDLQSKERTVCDLVASMTDLYALNLYQKIFFPLPVV
jgi:dGTPase